MFKNLLLFLSILLPSLASAQTLLGSWNFHAPFAGVQSIVDTPDKVYYVSKGALFSYDKENQESYTFTTSNSLNDSGISNIFYNPEAKYLLVAYSNGNIDLVYDNGKIINMSDIKDAVLTSLKNINGVSFVDGLIFIATDFGVVIADETSHTVKESGIYNTKINSFTKVGDNYIFAKSDGIWSTSAKNRINNIGNFKKIYPNEVFEILPLDSDSKAVIRPKYDLSLIEFNFNDNTYKNLGSFGPSNAFTNHFNPCADGFYNSNGKLIGLVAKDGSSVSNKAIPASTPIYNQPLAFWKNSDNIWTSNSKGIANAEWDGKNSVTFLTDYFAPGAFSVSPVDILKSDNFGRIYATTISNTRRTGAVYTPSDEYPTRKATNINIIEKDGSIVNIAPNNMLNPYSIRRYTAYAPNVNKDPGNMAMGISVTPHPTDPDIMFVSNRYDGLYKVSATDGCLYLYGADNSQISWDGWQSYVGFTDFDRKGNLWVAQYVNPDANDRNTNLLMLPADKVDKPETTKDDWVAIETDLEIGIDPMLTVCKNSNIIALYSSNGEEDGGIVFYDTRGTISTSDDRQQRYTTYVDQDGKIFAPIRIICITEVENGKLWVGTDDGIFEISNPESMIGEGRINRIKVPRNDGTGLADYLMNSQLVMDIAMDASNNKWIATLDGGLFQVSADGRSILQNFTKDNSALSSNTILSVECSPVSNVIYVGTNDGLFEYQSTSAPAEADYSNVIAYPNPVRPDYSGWITVKGLMANSLVKITDTAGNIVAQGTSDGAVAHVA